MARIGWICVFAAIGVSMLTMDVGALTSTTSQTSTAPCGTETDPVTLSPPSGLRIIGGSGESFDGDIPSGPSAGPEPESTADITPQTSRYEYFDRLSQLPECRYAYALRTQAQIDQFRYGRGAYAPRVDYDATVDAAKWSWPPNTLSAEQIRLPIMLQRPASGVSKLLIISDHRWDASWLTEFTTGDTGIRLDGWKWLQVTSNVNASETRQQIWFEPQMRFIGQYDPIIALYGFRGYQGVRAPTINNDTRVDGYRFGESLGPMLTAFKSYANTWTRIWIEVTERAGDQYASISAWMADENQAPVQILQNAEMFSYGVHTQFWFEYNTSSETRIGGPMAAWGRNVIVLKDVADPSTTFAKPVK